MKNQKTHEGEMEIQKTLNLASTKVVVSRESELRQNAENNLIIQYVFLCGSKCY